MKVKMKLNANEWNIDFDGSIKDWEKIVGVLRISFNSDKKTVDKK